MPLVNANSVNLYYEYYGQGQPLVLVNGLGTDISENKTLIHDLTARHRVLAFDNRDAGRSTIATQPYTIHDLSEDVAALMQTLNWPKADILGISMGGRVALELALTHPEKVNKLILVSTAARVLPSWRRSLLFAVMPRLPLFKGRYPQPLAAFKRQRSASSHYNVRDQLSKINTPTLILHGRQDWIAQYKLAEELQQGIANSILLPFKGGHGFYRGRQRHAYIEAIDRFN